MCEFSIASGILSADGWWVCVFLSCWLFGLRCSNTSGQGQVLVLKDLLESLCQLVFPWVSATSDLAPTGSHSQPPPPQETLHNPQVRSGRGSCGVTALRWVPVHLKSACALSDWSLFSPVPWRSCIQAPLVFRADILRAPPLDVRPSGWGAWRYAQNFHSVGKPLRYNYFLVSGWITGGYGIYVAKVPVLLSRCGLLLISGSTLSLLVGPSPFMMAVVLQFAVVLVFLWEERSAPSSPLCCLELRGWILAASLLRMCWPLSPHYGCAGMVASARSRDSRGVTSARLQVF